MSIFKDTTLLIRFQFFYSLLYIVFINIHEYVCQMIVYLTIGIKKTLSQP